LPEYAVLFKRISANSNFNLNSNSNPKAQNPFRVNEMTRYFYRALFSMWSCMWHSVYEVVVKYKALEKSIFCNKKVTISNSAGFDNVL